MGPQADIAPIVRALRPCGAPRCRARACPRSPRSLPAELPRPATEDADPRSVYLNFPVLPGDSLLGLDRHRPSGTFPRCRCSARPGSRASAVSSSSEVDFFQDFDATDRALHRSSTTSQDVYQHTAELQWTGSAGRRAAGVAGRAATTRASAATATSMAQQRPRPPGSPSVPITIDQDTENFAFGARAAHACCTLSGERALRARRALDQGREGAPSSSATTSTTSAPWTGPGIHRLRGKPRVRPPLSAPTEQHRWCSEHLSRPDVGHGPGLASLRRRSPALREARPRLQVRRLPPGARGTYLPEKIWAYAAGYEVRVLRLAPAAQPRGLLLQLPGHAARRARRHDACAPRTPTRACTAGTSRPRATPIEGLDLGVVVSFLKTEVLEYYTLDPADLTVLQRPDRQRACRAPTARRVQPTRLERNGSGREPDARTENPHDATPTDRTCYPFAGGVASRAVNRARSLCGTGHALRRARRLQRQRAVARAALEDHALRVATTSRSAASAR